MTTTTDPIAMLLRVEALNLRKDELIRELHRLCREVDRNPTLALVHLPRIRAIDNEIALLARSAADMRREQIEEQLRERDAAARRAALPWYRRLFSWR